MPAAAPRKLVQKKVILSSEYKICIKLQKMFCNNTYLSVLDQTARKTQKSATNFGTNLREQWVPFPAYPWWQVQENWSGPRNWQVALAWQEVSLRQWLIGWQSNAVVVEVIRLAFVLTLKSS